MCMLGEGRGCQASGSNDRVVGSGMNTRGKQLSHGLGKERVVTSVRCAVCGAVIKDLSLAGRYRSLKLMGDQVRNRCGNCQLRGYKQTTRVDEMIYDKSQNSPSNLQFRP